MLQPWFYGAALKCHKAFGTQNTTAVSPPYPPALHFNAYIMQVLRHDPEED